MYITVVIHSLGEPTGDHKVLLRLTDSTESNMYLCMWEREKCLLGQAREVICRLLSSSGANIHKVCLSRAMEIYIYCFFSDEVLE